MSSKSHKDKKNKRRSSPAVLAVLSGGLALVALFWFWWGNIGSEFQQLPGKWLRTDGGYVIEIRSVNADGKTQAGYYNPNPINVSRAEATQEQDRVKVFIELRDVNYPGSTYTLRYDRERDVLEGIYYQAALQQSFTVRFIRMD
jgi:hypothetical protein